MSKKKQFRLNKKTVIIAIIVIVALGILYYINARNGGDSSTLTSNLIGAVMGDDAAQGLQGIVQDVSGVGQGQQADNSGNNGNGTDDSPAGKPTATPTETPVNTVSYKFRNNKLLTQHYEKHGIEMGFKSKEDYEKAASAVINNPNALHKTEKEDGDYVYYVEDTNEFVILSTDGYIRTYFLPSAGISYYNRQ